MVAIDFKRINPAPKSQNDSFETLAAALFKRHANVPAGSAYTRFRGAGGDGGVEAIYTAPDRTVYGMQAKYFFHLGNSELSQVKDSLAAALENYPALRDFSIYLPFDLTGSVAAGRRGKSETQRMQEWKDAVESKAQQGGTALSITLVPGSEVERQLLASDSNGGWRRYWFESPTLTTENIRICLNQSIAFAGPRFTSALDVVTQAHETLDVFGGTKTINPWVETTLRPSVQAFLSTTRDTQADGNYKVLGKSARQSAEAALASARDALKSILKSPEDAQNVQVALKQLDLLIPLTQKAEEQHLGEFVKKHGADRDTPAYRQYRAEYMCDFPASALDQARDTLKYIEQIKGYLKLPLFSAAGAKSLLMVGPAGIGKTHSLVSAASRRLDVGAWSLVLFGEDFGSAEPWEVIRSKLGFGANLSRDELFGCMEAASFDTGVPFLLVIDALNESPRAEQWKQKLGELLEQIKPFEGIKTCVSTRDTFRGLVIDERFPGLAFESAGFAGNELQALEAFCELYGLQSEITPLFADELTNPLFLHLACKTLKAQGQTVLDLSLPGFIKLFEDYLGVCDKAIRSRLGYRNPANLVRACLNGLVEAAVQDNTPYLPWTRAVELIESATSKEVGGGVLLDELAKQGLVIVARDPTAADDVWIVRFAFQRYFDVLRALQLLGRCVDASGSMNYTALATALVAGAPEDAGLVEALAAVLPEKYDCEIADSEIRLDEAIAYKAFVQALPWRSRQSFGRSSLWHFESALNVEGLWQSALETLLKVSLVPGHPLNAEYLHSFLTRRSLTERDPYWALVLYQSYSKSGVVSSLIQAVLRADLSRWPASSRELAGVVITWFCAAPDRRVRDLGAKALTRLIRVDPGLAAPLIERFSSVDDDFVKERLLQASYSALLLDKPVTPDPYIDALRASLQGGYDSSNVVYRDHIRLIAMTLGTRVLNDSLRAELDRYPTRCAPLASWPTADDVKAMLDVPHLPSSMKLVASLRPDFSRYVVEPRISSFLLKESGLSVEAVLYWIMAEAKRLGFPGEGEMCMAYDGVILNEYGPGRGRRTFAERLGKKYYWIAFHRLMGLLADTIPAKKGHDEVIPPGDHLWSRDIRDIDLTDFRDLEPPREYPVELLNGLEYSFDNRASDDRAWVKNDDLLPHEANIVRADHQGAEWIALGLSQSTNDRDVDQEIMTGSYRNISIDYSSVLVESAFKFRGGTAGCRTVDDAMQSLNGHDYRGYLAEYPRGRVFQQAEGGPNIFTVYERDSRSFLPARIDLLRGNEWERDCSAEERHETLPVPGPDLIEKLDLQWDRHSGWVDKSGILTCIWLKSDRCSGLFVRRSALERYLAGTRQDMLVNRFVCKSRHKGGGISAQSDMYSHLRFGTTLTVLHEAIQVIPR